jgi:DNA-binding NtrC family response regulator
VAVPWPVRIEGPTGTGKGLAARLLHEWSGRRDGPFVACHLNVVSDGLEVAELVGHVRGAFTGAIADRRGVFEAAHGGTLFLDEIVLASPRVQQALLQLLEERAVRRLGEQRVRGLDVRLVFATNANLEQAMLAGAFRRDLYYRLGSLRVRMPALREHVEDIPALAERILEMKCLQADVPRRTLPPDLLDTLMRHDWPGNVRELDRALEHYVTFGALPASIRPGAPAADWRERVDEVLRQTGGNKTEAARLLGISRQTLHEVLRERKA